MPNPFTRRCLLKGLTSAAVAGTVRLPMRALWLPQGETATPRERGEIGRLAAGFKRRFSVPSLSIAISRNSQFVSDQGFCFNQEFQFGNLKDMGPTDMSSLSRIADVTMPITSVAIFTLIEQGKLNLTDKVLGASGFLGPSTARLLTSNT